MALRVRARMVDQVSLTARRSLIGEEYMIFEMDLKHTELKRVRLKWHAETGRDEQLGERSVADNRMH
jgi:hypothetical protein